MPTAEQTTMSILVVDDNEANRLLAQNTLEDEGYRVVLATGGIEGLAAYERERPDCMLLDVRMPDLDGFAVCERIRAMPRGGETPIIFLTALRDVDTFDHALRAGGDDFLTKPVRPTELVVRVQTALKLRRIRIELHEQYELLKAQRDAVMRLQLQKERLTAFVVHDLKNPVNSMDLHAQLLLRDKSLDERARSSVLQIRSEARQLTRMILNLLDISKADEGKLSPKVADVQLDNLVADILHELDVSAQAKKVKLASALEVSKIRGDEDLLRRTVANLVENAIRHAPSGSAVTVSSKKALPRGIELHVSDEGRGIQPEMRERIFDAFTQVESGDVVPARSGRGLGLTFCKLAVVAHEGEIWVEDAAPGARFCVRLPSA